MARTRFQTAGCPSGCWITRDETGSLVCDCSGAFHARLRGASRLGGVTGGQALAGFLVLLGAAAAGKVIADRYGR